MRQLRAAWSRVNGGPVQVEFWGVRGSIACGGKDYLRYGGNTSCVSVSSSGHTVILDAGTGIRALGDRLLARKAKSIHIFLSHTHFDHVCGFPFFAPAYDPSVQITVWSGHLGNEGATRAVMAKLMEAPLFPVDPAVFKAKIAYRDFEPGHILEPFPGIILGTAALNHPNGSTGYRVECSGRVVVYASDLEHGEGEPAPELVTLSKRANLLIYDATYTDAEYPEHRGWGHSTWQEGVRLAEAAGAKALALFHHDPSHDDRRLRQIEKLASAMAAKSGIKVFAAREGLIFRP
jgi:phosphoribosyl 1,2-cyclic phosphodiesterase